jgi:hypothetical protein
MWELIGHRSPRVLGGVRGLRLLVVLGLAVSVAACREPTPEPVRGRCEDAEAGVACMEIADGADASPIADGSEVELVFGPQGGWHVEVGMRFRGIDTEGTLLTYEARREDDGEIVSTMRYGITPRRLGTDGDHRLRTGDLVVFDITSADQITDRAITIEARLEDENGAEVASDVRTLQVVDLLP